MREHKYRAWHKIERKMVYFTLGHLLGSYCDEFNYCSIADTDLYRWHDSDELEIMEYIGLKDVAGKEIYEGDILGIENATAKVVFWERPPEFRLDFHHNEDEWCEDWNLSDDHDRMEIIGNVWETPELLEAR